MHNMFVGSGFQRTSNFMGSPLRGSFIGAVDKANRDRLVGLINAGTPKLAAVKKWILSKIQTDPTMINTFKEQYIADNFAGYGDIVAKDQTYVDQAIGALSSSDPALWNIPDATIGRVEEWAQVVDIMYAAMLEYGGATAPAVTSPGIPSLTLTPGATLPFAAVPAPSSALSNNNLLIGGAVALGLGILAYAIL